MRPNSAFSSAAFEIVVHAAKVAVTSSSLSFMPIPDDHLDAVRSPQSDGGIRETKRRDATASQVFFPVTEQKRAQQIPADRDREQYAPHVVPVYGQHADSEESGQDDEPSLNDDGPGVRLRRRQYRSVILALCQYTCIGCSPGKCLDIRPMAAA